MLDHKNQLIGIVSEKDLLYASPSPVTSLNVWEIHELLSAGIEDAADIIADLDQALARV